MLECGMVPGETASLTSLQRRAKEVLSVRISFVLPGYFSFPIGGYRVVYEYANFLAKRKHHVTIVFKRNVTAEGESHWLNPVKKHLWGIKTRLRNRPLVAWHALHPGIRLMLVSEANDRSIPDGDVIVATAWSTAQPIACLASRKGAKFYLIQHHEIWDGPADAVNATWRLPLHKIVISKWLQEVGAQIGAHDMRHIPNGLDLTHFRVTRPPETRPMSVLSLYHDQAFKGVPDALAVLQQYHERYPKVPVTMFGFLARSADLPDWMNYVQNPDQKTLVENLYNGHTVYLSASLAEGWALPPAESMACGCAFVGTDSGGCRDFATDGDTALLSQPGDRNNLLQNLIRVTDDEALRSAIQRRGTESIQQFTWAAAGQAIEAYFKEYA